MELYLDLEAPQSRKALSPFLLQQAEELGPKKGEY